MYVCICMHLNVNTSKICVLKNQFSPVVSLTRPTGDDAMSVKQGFLLEQQNILYFSFVQPTAASPQVVPAVEVSNIVVTVILNHGPRRRRRRWCSFRITFTG